MRVKGFLNNDDEGQVKGFVKNLIKSKNLEEGDLNESGGLGVRYEANYDGELVFEVHRLIATVTVSKKKVEELKKE